MSRRERFFIKAADVVRNGDQCVALVTVIGFAVLAVLMITGALPR